jgi:dolichol-phosphate mannosyltransferase
MSVLTNDGFSKHGRWTTLTVIVPCYNEATTIDEILRRIIELPFDKQVIVVDDGSTDGSSEMIAAWDGREDVEVLQHNRNRGKGAAIRTALEKATGRFVVVQDADLETDPQDYEALLAPERMGKSITNSPK